TPFATVQSYWQAGYNYQPANGFGLWDGTQGVTSSVARASHQDLGQISVGYIDGGIQNTLGFDLHNDLGGPTLATNRILVRPSYNGDLNFDGYVDGNDIGIIISLGYYGSSDPDGCFDGD